MAHGRIHGAPSPSPGIWTSALATAIVLALLGVLIGIVAINAFSWFWPATLYEVQLTDGSRVFGPKIATEADPAGGHRTKYKVGARDLDGRDFRWIAHDEISGVETPDDLVRIERTEYGDVFGRLVALTDSSEKSVDVHDRAAIAAVVNHGLDFRRQRKKLLHDWEKARQPLTAVEEKLASRERSGDVRSPDLAAAIADLETRRQRVEARLLPKLESLERSMAAIDADLEQAVLTVDAGRGTVEVPLGHLVRLSRPNAMSMPARLWDTLRRSSEFLTTEPREANTEGGVYPALFGTVLLVLLMTLAVVPLGVVTAVYMTEYARKGWLLNLATRAVHNLAGVPSIVFGMFGLGFFIYGVGGTLDRWFFADRLPTPTMGTGGILWASLTLALLTLPVVVVASREGLMTVPREWRDGAAALGATRWQTLKTIVLPAAMPGILTGVILAVGRAAGEVAPLMLTGAVKLAPSLPIDGTVPFLHLDRKFMHLGFFIYDVSMQSPNVEAAKPMAFATTLVLLALVATLNVTAIVIRRRFQRNYRGADV